MIMENCDSLLPDYLRFVRGVVDSPDLSLNISRELLQHDRQLKVIGQNLERRCADLEKFLKDDREGYEKFYANFGRQLGYGIVSDGGEARRDSLKELLMFYSSTEKKLTTLKEYVSAHEGRPEVHLLCRRRRASRRWTSCRRPSFLKDKDYEILYLTGETDEFTPASADELRRKPFRSIVDGDLELGGEEEHKDDSESAELMQFVKETLGGKIKEAKVSHRLKTSSCLPDGGRGLQLRDGEVFQEL